jgi:hypothetical protein
LQQGRTRNARQAQGDHKKRWAGSCPGRGERQEIQRAGQGCENHKGIIGDMGRDGEAEAVNDAQESELKA